MHRRLLIPVLAARGAGTAAGQATAPPRPAPLPPPGATLPAPQTAGLPAGPGRSTTQGIFPLSAVHRGLTGTAYTVFEGTAPEPVALTVLGLIHNALGPGQDLILARLVGAKPEFTGVVAGMSGSPVYIDGRLAGALAYRIGTFTREPIAGITPIEEMLEVRDAEPAAETGLRLAAARSPALAPAAAELLPTGAAGMDIVPMETPLVMSGFSPAAIDLWRQRMAGTPFAAVAAGGGAAGRAQAVLAAGPGPNASSLAPEGQALSGPQARSGSGSEAAPASASAAPMPGLLPQPGQSVSAQLVRGDVEIAATCTITYVDPRQLLACGHPITQYGAVSLPMTAAEVVTTVASPLNAFKIVNTGAPLGAFTDDRHTAVRGFFGRQARMIPISVTVRGDGSRRDWHVEVVDLPELTPNAAMVSLYQMLLETNAAGQQATFHIRGRLRLSGYEPVPIDTWVAPGEMVPSTLAAALAVSDRLSRLYGGETASSRLSAVELEVERLAERRTAELESARLVEPSVRPGTRAAVDVTLRPWRGQPRTLRLEVPIPPSMPSGRARILLADGATLARILEAQRAPGEPQTLEATVAALRQSHSPDRLYATLLVPSAQAALGGAVIADLPLTLANVYEPLRSAQAATLSGESALPAASADAQAVLSGQQILTVNVE
jgi:hypothetical protein